MKLSYGFGREVIGTFEEVIDRVIEALKVEGFGVLTDIDVADTLKKKLNEEMPPYRILGACNPPLAHQALLLEPSIGHLLPCNVVVRQDATGIVHVEFMDPNAVLELVGRPEVAELAEKVKIKMERVQEAL